MRRLEVLVAKLSDEEKAAFELLLAEGFDTPHVSDRQRANIAKKIEMVMKEDAI